MILNPKDFSKNLKLGGGQILERRNVEQPIFRNFKIANIKITKDELFDVLGWESKFGTTECRTTNISEFQNYEY